MDLRPNIQIKPFLKNNYNKQITLDFDKSDNRFLNSENLNKLHNINSDQNEKDTDTNETPLSIQNSMLSSNNMNK